MCAVLPLVSCAAFSLQRRPTSDFESSPSEAAQLEEAVAELVRRLVAAGVDPRKADVIARGALSGAAAPAEDAAAEARRVLLGRPPVQP